MTLISSDWLINLRTNEIAPKYYLICFPFAGGGTINYSRWRNDLHKEIGLYAFNLPGRERFFTQPCVTDYAQLILNMAKTIESTVNGPMIFFGHSFGALTAYFTALELKKRNITPIHVYTSGRVSPKFSKEKSISGLDLENFKSMLIQRYQGIPTEILNNQSLLELFIPLIQKDFKMYEQYPQILSSYTAKVIDCSLTSISYLEDKSSKGDFLSWKEYTNGSYRHFEMPGGHFEIIKNWKPIVDIINHSILTSSM